MELQLFCSCSQTAYWCKFNHAEIGIMDALKLLDVLVDESDPDVNTQIIQLFQGISLIKRTSFPQVDIPNSIHAFQTAERIREMHPDKPWFHLTGLIHDLGKVMAVWGEHQVSLSHLGIQSLLLISSSSKSLSGALWETPSQWDAPSQINVCLAKRVSRPIQTPKMMITGKATCSTWSLPFI